MVVFDNISLARTAWSGQVAHSMVGRLYYPTETLSALMFNTKDVNHTNEKNIFTWNVIKTSC